MSYVVDIQFFNTFILRSTDINTLYIEESRIKGGFNEAFATLGPKAYATNENYDENRRKNALIYSGIYNSKTEVNNTNVFSAGEKITRAVDPANGSIQKLYAEDTNLNILQENKVSKALIDKDALFTAEGGQLTASGAAVIGQIVPYAGKYGISKDPESFAIKGNRKYFTDKNRGAVLRLSGGQGKGDGITEISRAGMRDFFKDNLKSATRIVGMYDDNKDEYVLSIKNGSSYNTLSYDESVKGWTSFFTYSPDYGFTIKKDFFTLKDGDLYKHYVDNTVSGATVDRNEFYESKRESYVTFIANMQPSVVKNFNTINYEGSAGWVMRSSNTDFGDTAKNVLSSATTVASGVIPVSFIKKENKYYAHLRNTASKSTGEIAGVEPMGLKGFFTIVKMEHTSSSAVELFTVSHDATGKFKKPPTTTKK